MSGPLLLSVLLLNSSPKPLCFVPEDQTAGWKRVAIPAHAPALAAPAELDQFRGGELSWAWTDDARAFLGMHEDGPGKEVYRFAIAPGGRQLDVEFAEPLRGAKVDIAARAGHRRYVLADERRVSGAAVSATWNVPDVQEVAITVHHHVRATPIVDSWRLGRQVDIARESSTPSGFRNPGYLYYRHPGGRRVELCDSPGLPLSLSGTLPDEKPTEVHSGSREAEPAEPSRR